MTALKDRISSPLEAGTSLLDAHHLPHHLNPALEYVSSRLAKKSLHLTLVIVRRDYQLPAFVPSHFSTLSLPSGFPSPALTAPGTPPLTGGSNGSSRFAFNIKQLMRSASDRVSSRSVDATITSRSAMSSPAYPPPGLDSPRLRWPLTPSSTMPLSPPPMTPCTSSSIATSDTNGPPTPNPLALRFFCATDISPKAEKVLKSTLSKAGAKYGCGSNWLTQFSSPSTRELTNQLFHSSIVQNEVLFSSDGLTLLSLDRLYSVKSALSSYSKTLSPMRLEDAVDELRRYVLANNGVKITRSNLLRSYDWLSVSNSAMAELDRMYRRAYGGAESIGGICGMPLAKPVPHFDANKEVLLSQFEDDSDEETQVSKDDAEFDDDFDDDDDDDFDDDEPFSPNDSILDASIIGVAVTTFQVFKPPSPRKITPNLRVQTTFKNRTQTNNKLTVPNSDAHEEDGDRTARPIDRSQSVIRSMRANTNKLSSSNYTIDQVLTAGPVTPARDSVKFGPSTPKAYDDISPITRGEWGFLMVDNGFAGGRTAAVERCH